MTSPRVRRLNFNLAMQRFETAVHGQPEVIDLRDGGRLSSVSHEVQLSSFGSIEDDALHHIVRELNSLDESQSGDVLARTGC